MEHLYECHITFLPTAKIPKEHFNKWKFSEINGDPVLGQKKYKYLTKYSKNFEELLQDAYEVKKIFWGVVRIKVEEIVFDKRFDV